MARPDSRALTLARALNVAPVGTVRGPVSLRGSMPARGEHLLAAPDSIQLSFDGDVRLTMLTVTDAHGRRVETDFAISLRPMPAHRVAVARLEPGAYVIAWQARTSYGYRLKGDFGFSVDNLLRAHN